MRNQQLLPDLLSHFCDLMVGAAAEQTAVLEEQAVLLQSEQAFPEATADPEGTEDRTMVATVGMLQTVAQAAVAVVRTLIIKQAEQAEAAQLVSGHSLMEA
jgi:hypothetical protein